MEDQQYYKLYKFLNTKLSMMEVDSGFVINNSIPYHEFNSYSNSLASRFIGECNRNIYFNGHILEFVLSELKNYKLKIERRFKKEFKIDYYKQEKGSLELVKNYSGNKFGEKFTPIVQVKLEIYESILIHLDLVINDNMPKQKSREKAVRESFKIKLKDEDIIEFGQSLVDEELIWGDVRLKDIESVFSGKRITNMIVWKGDAYSLALLIRLLNKENCFEKKFHDGLWDIVVDIFRPSKEPYYEIKTLRNSSPTKNKNYENIKYLVEDVVNIIKDYSD